MERTKKMYYDKQTLWIIMIFFLVDRVMSEYLVETVHRTRKTHEGHCCLWDETEGPMIPSLNLAIPKWNVIRYTQKLKKNKKNFGFTDLAKY